jgi:hypothetical protein
VPVPLTSHKVARAKVVTMAQYEAIDAVGLDAPSSEKYAYNGFNQLLSISGTTGRRRRSGTTGTATRPRRRYDRRG